MTLLSWLIVVIPLIFVLGFAIYSRRYVRDVSDFLVAGRVAGRYVISVANLESALGVLTLIALVEVNYATGLAMTFWNALLLPLGMFISLTGFCAYRYRETKSLSIGQFLEMRYSRSFRIFATILRTFAEILTNCIGPAVAVRFFIYFLNLPHKINILGFECSTFMLLLIFFLILALTVILSGGQIALIVTDSIQALMSYPIFVIFTVYIITQLSWFQEITPVLTAHAADESFINPYDVENLRDFNLFALILTLIARPYSTAVWYGNGTSGAGRTPHEQKMAGVLGEWRNGLSVVMCTLIAILVITVMNHANFRDVAHKVRTQLSTHVAAELISDKADYKKVSDDLKQLNVPTAEYINNKVLTRKDNFDTPFLNQARESMLATFDTPEEANHTFLKFRSLYNQNMLPVTIRNMCGPFLLGLFALLMFMLMLSTDDSRIFNSAATIVQDIIAPLRGKPFTPKGQLNMLRFMTIVVAIIFFCGSMFLAQMDYIQLFVNITTSLWICGAGSVMIFGLYSRFGTTAGAYAALISGAFISGGGFLIQRNWPKVIYPWIEENNLVEAFTKFFEVTSRPFNPYIVWEMNPVKFPINSKEIFFLSMAVSILLYCVVSYLTCKTPYNLDRLLHRGKYNFDGDDKSIKMDWSLKNIFRKLIGITPNYTKGDKAIAYSMFIYTFIYKFVLAFLLVIICNIFFPWKPEWWSKYFLTTQILIPGPIGAVTTVWFVIGGIIDLKRMFKDLKERKQNYLDNGQVQGQVSLADAEAVRKAENEK